MEVNKLFGDADNRKYAIYSRKSKYTGKGESIENQIEICRERIKMRYANVTDEDIMIYEDEGFSGKNTKRPKFQEMMKDIRDNKIKVLAFYRLDRISRNVSDFSSLVDEFDKYNLEFHSCSENFDTSTPSGKAMMMMISVFAQFERDVIAERIRDNMHELAKTGRWLGGVSPTGFKSIAIESIELDGEKSKTVYKLDTIKSERHTVEEEIFKKFFELNSLTKLETYLWQNRIYTKNGKKFTRFAIKAILMNPVYAIADEATWNYFKQHGVTIYSDKSQFDGKHGIMAYNKTSQADGSRHTIKDIKEWIIAVGRHIGFIPGAEWVRIQQMLHQNKDKSFRKPKSNTALLSGLLFCGNCGNYMRPKMGNRTTEDGERIFSYLCRTKEISKNLDCDIKRPNGNILDKMIIEHIKELAQNESEFVKQLGRIKKQSVKSTESYENKLTALKKELTDNSEKISNLVMHMASLKDLSTSNVINEEIKKLQDSNVILEEKINEWNKLSENNILSERDFDLLKSMLQSFATTLDTMGLERCRIALRAFVKKVVFDGENVHIYLFGSDTNPDDREKIHVPNDLHLLKPQGEDSK